METEPVTQLKDARADGMRLAHDEVHLWIASLDRGDCVVASSRAILDGAERARADRFRFETDRARFVAAHAILRRLLGAYLSCAPQSVRFKFNRWGKPALAPQFDAACGTRMRFNLSHSHGLAVYAFALERELGVDVEKIRPDFATDEVAERFFAPAEVRELRALPAHSRAEAFFNCWTRKEAYVKARGEGLAIDLSSFEVTLRPGDQARLRWTRADGAADARWSLASWTVASRAQDGAFAIALAAAGERVRFAPPRWL